MATHVDRIVLPGDKINNLKESEASKKVILGPGLRIEAEDVYACKPGVLKFREPNVYWIDTHQKRVKKEFLSFLRAGPPSVLGSNWLWWYLVITANSEKLYSLKTILRPPPPLPPVV